MNFLIRFIGSVLIFFVFNIKVEGQSAFNKFLPKEFTLQYAGSIGLVSAGINYPLHKNKFDLGIAYGYVPKSAGGRLDIASVKFRYNMIRVPVKNKFLILPFNPTIFGSYTFHENLNLGWSKEQYPKNYYWWSPALRFHAGFSSEFKFFMKHEKTVKSISLYSEVNSNDLYIVSYFLNHRALSFWQILGLGVGVRIGV